MNVMNRKNVLFSSTAVLTLGAFLCLQVAQLGLAARINRAAAQETATTKKVAIFVLPASDSEVKSALLLNRVLRENVRGLTAIELVAPAPVLNSGALPELQKLVEDAYQALNAKRVPDALGKLTQAKPLLEQLLPAVSMRTLALFYKSWGVAQALSNNLPEARSAIEISLILFPDQTNLEYAYSVEVLKMFMEISADLERRPSGILNVESKPENAVVVVDSREPNLTPARVANLPAGPHLVKVVMDGYEQWAGFVQVAGSETRDISVPLRPISEKALFDERLVAVSKVMKKDPDVAAPALGQLKAFLGADEVLALECSVVGESYELKGFHVKSDASVLPVKRTLARDASFLAGVKEFLSGLFESFYEIGRKAEGLGGPPIDPVVLQKAGVTSQQGTTVFDPDNPVFPTVDLGGKKKESIFDKWWFWVGVGVVVAGGAAGGYAIATSGGGSGGPTGCVKVNVVPME